MPERLESLGERLNRATGDLSGPLAVIDLDVFESNARALVIRAGGTPVRLATKSVRVRALIDRVLAAGNGWAGVMAYSLQEALWLVDQGHRDILLGYPSVDRHALRDLLASPEARTAITLMLDDVAQARLIAGSGNRVGDQPVRVCVDIDASWRPGVGRFRLHLGARRSPVHTPAEAADVVREMTALGGFEVHGLMFYEAQVAGLPDSSPAVRLVKRASNADLATRRAAVAAAVEDVLGRRLDLINSGGTGSLETSSADPVVTEVTAGSGLLLPTLFDDYRSITSRPAAYFGIDVVRRPSAAMATAFGGGYVASGPAGASRLPRMVDPVGAKLTGSEAAGEVQTPIRLPAGTTREVGDRVWLRHAKAGELMERFTHVHLVRGDSLVETVQTYRGEGQSFG